MLMTKRALREVENFVTLIAVVVEHFAESPIY